MGKTKREVKRSIAGWLCAHCGESEGYTAQGLDAVRSVQQQRQLHSRAHARTCAGGLEAIRYDKVHEVDPR